MSIVVVDVWYVASGSRPRRKSIKVGGTKEVVDFLWKHYGGSSSMWGYLLNEERTKCSGTSCIGITDRGVCATLSPLKEFRVVDPFAEALANRTYASLHYEKILPWEKFTDAEKAYIYANYVYSVPKEVEKNPLFMLMLAGL